MTLSKLRDGLQRYLPSESHQNHSHPTELEQVIAALQEKDARLRERLTREADPTKRHQLMIELEVTRLQQEKGLARQEALMAGQS